MKRLSLFLAAAVLVSCRSLSAGRPNPGEVAPESISQQQVTDNELENTIQFKEFKALRTAGPLIPGLRQPAVPQGMAYWPEQGMMIISNYMDDGSAGILTFIDLASGSLDKTLRLYNSDRTPHTGHLGGLALGADHLWIASGPGVYPVRLEHISSAADNVYLPPLLPTETKGSFATFYKDILWVGEFTRKDGSYAVPQHHHAVDREGKPRRGWLAGYRTEPEDGLLLSKPAADGKITPDFIISIPDEIQGAVFTEEIIFLSASYGRKNNSRLLIYDSPLDSDPHLRPDIFGDHPFSFWFLDGLNRTGKIIMPPMSEAIVSYDGRIAVLFESAASKYRSTANFPIDRIQYLPSDMTAETE